MSDLLLHAEALSSVTKRTGGWRSGENTFTLKAGSLDLIFEEGSLRYIRFGNNEVLRMIYFAVRDSQWLNVPCKITKLEKEINDDSFLIEYSCLFGAAETCLKADFIIEGTSDCTVSVTVSGEVLSSFRKNRIGFCVLHPVEECAGKDCRIIHSDSSVEVTKFPANISPCQPFTDVSEMHWQTGSNSYRLHFAGDIFETEDQRNWTDASFKTYSTPLRLPFPVEVIKGEKIFQKIALSAVIREQNIKSSCKTINISFDRNEISPVPKIGICHSSLMTPLSENEVSVLQEIHFDHYRIDIHLYREHWGDRAEEALTDAAKLRLKVELTLFTGSDPSGEVTRFIEWVKIVHPGIALVTIFSINSPATPAGIADQLVGLLTENLPGVKICCGTNANFAQLNRERPVSVLNDYLTFSIHPQEHASDNQTLVENLRGQEYTVISCREFARGKGVWISPVTLRRRFNANTDNFERESTGQQFPEQADSRIMSLFGAGWTVGSLKYLAGPGAAGITFFETKGERGIIQGDKQSRWPDRFNTFPGMIFPVWYVFRFILSDKSFMNIKNVSSDPLKVECFSVIKGNRMKIILVNFTDTEQTVILRVPEGKLTVMRLDETTYAEAATSPAWLNKPGQELLAGDSEISISPYSVNFIEGIATLY